MNISLYFNNLELLDEKIDTFVLNKELFEKKFSKNLIESHLAKAEHNLKLFSELRSEFNDWKIVVLYYSLYHSCLALLANKSYVSKNYFATLLFVIKNYSQINLEDIKLIETLQIKEEDAKFYTDLMLERHKASYSSSIIFKDDEILVLRERTLKFLNKVKIILG